MLRLHGELASIVRVHVVRLTVAFGVSPGNTAWGAKWEGGKPRNDHMCVCTHTHLSIYLSIHPSIYLPTYLPIYLSIYLPIYKAIYLYRHDIVKISEFWNLFNAYET